MTTDNYNTIIDRLTVFLKTNGLTKASVARDFNMSQPTVNGYFLKEGSSRRAMPLSFLADLANEYPQLDMNWLFRGKSLESDNADTIRLTEQNTKLKNAIDVMSRIIAESES